MTPRDGNIEAIISLGTVIQSGISLSKTKSISETPSCFRTIKEEELSLIDIFEFSLYDHGLVFKKRTEDIEHNIFVDEYMLGISDNENQSYE